MKNAKSLDHGHRFPAVVISRAVRWYFRFQLSLRGIEELLFERGVIVSYETIRRWCDKFGAGFAHRIKTARRKPGSTWQTKRRQTAPGTSLLIPQRSQDGVQRIGRHENRDCLLHMRVDVATDVIQRFSH